MLKTAKIISDESKEDEVGINNTVTLYFEEDDETEVYKLVTSIRGDSLDGRISIESMPLRRRKNEKTGCTKLLKANKQQINQ